MFTFGTMTVDERPYTITDANQIILTSQFGLGDDFYGGRVTHIGKTDSDVVLLMTDANTVIDTGAKDLTNISINTVRGLCKRRKFALAPNTSKEKMIRMLGGKVSSEESGTESD
jgi:hypothetical protein